MENENCYISNHNSSPYPILLNTKPSNICLACAGLSYWAQVIFQLSHEMCHFAFRQNRNDKNRYFVLSWFEELVCEAFSLYCLRFSMDHWLECALSKMNPSFDSSIEQYLQNELNKKGNDRFSGIETVDDLIAYENKKGSENDRDSQRNERNLLYYEIIKNPEECRELCNYQNYLVVPSNISIDFEKWVYDTNNDVVKFISKLVNF